MAHANLNLHARHSLTVITIASSNADGALARFTIGGEEEKRILIRCLTCVDCFMFHIANICSSVCGTDILLCCTIILSFWLQGMNVGARCGSQKNPLVVFGFEQHTATLFIHYLFTLDTLLIPLTLILRPFCIHLQSLCLAFSQPSLYISLLLPNMLVFCQHQSHL